MKCLSIKQPWADLILFGAKDIENRNWPTRMRGPVLVHAGKGFDKDALPWIEDVLASERDPEDPDRVARAIALVRNVVRRAGDYDRRGAVLGTVEIVDCVQESESPWFCGEYGFALRNPVRFAQPIPYRGCLGFFDVPDHLLPEPMGGRHAR